MSDSDVSQARSGHTLTRPRAILVHEAVVGEHSSCDWPVEIAHRLVYSFVDAERRDGFAAWVTGQTDAETRVDVVQDCRALSSGFAQHGLNRTLADILLRERPDVLIVQGVWGCTVDLPRIASLMRIPVVFDTGGMSFGDYPEGHAVNHWIRDAIRRCDAVVGEVPNWLRSTSVTDEGDDSIGVAEVTDALSVLSDRADSHQQFSYSVYEFLQRDHPLLYAMQRPDTRHFKGLGHVLDVACGVGIFLDCLRSSGVDAVGVERDPVVAEYARGLGLDVVTADAMEFLSESDSHFDGIYCSHFIEHLPVHDLELFLEKLCAALRPGGVAVLSFPDPESIRSQLLGFWRDPEHQRFYHPQLVITMAAAAGLDLEWSSYEDQPHDVVPFSLVPPEMPAFPLTPPDSPDSETAQSAYEKILGWLGLESRKAALERHDRWLNWAGAVIEAQARNREILCKLTERTDSLWAVNRTWAWNDNVTLRLRRKELSKA